MHPDGGDPSLYLTDPGYQAALAAEQQGLAQSQASTGAQIGQLQHQFQTTALPRLQAQHDLARRAVVNLLAAHGILRSGDTGYRLGQADQAYSNAVGDAEQNLVGQIQGLTNAQLNTAQGLHQNVISALQSAYQNFVNNPGLYTNVVPQTPAAPSANTPTAPTSRVPAHRAVARHLVNPYTTGQKLYG